MVNQGFFVITGATGGLGMATARLLASSGKNIILSDNKLQYYI